MPTTTSQSSRAQHTSKSGTTHGESKINAAAGFAPNTFFPRNPGNPPLRLPCPMPQSSTEHTLLSARALVSPPHQIPPESHLLWDRRLCFAYFGKPFLKDRKQEHVNGDGIPWMVGG